MQDDHLISVFDGKDIRKSSSAKFTIYIDVTIADGFD